MYCRECGNQVSEKTEICTKCGVRPLKSDKCCQSCGNPTKAEQELCVNCGVKLIKKNISADDNPSALLKLAVCCFPIVGVVLYFIWKNEKPNSANAACKWAIVGFVLGIILYIFGFVMAIISESMMYYY